MKQENLLHSIGLQHGGIMANYQCNAACRHCLYSCSPDRTPGYISQDRAQKICWLLRAGGCGSVHIGGGEPFLDFEGLLMLVRELNHAGIRLEYIETNGYWAADQEGARKKLERLLAEGADTLCISLDPFHAEYVPYAYPLHLHTLCEQTGMGDFLWKAQFLPVLSQLEPLKAHSRAEMEKSIAPAYISDTARLYEIRLGGRAVNIEQEYAPLHQAADLLDSVPCRGLLSSSHFHTDWQGYFIPPGCTGLRLPLAEVINGIPVEKYPVFETLYYRGIQGLLEYARDQGFSGDRAGYPSKCNLCFHIRRYLGHQGIFAELDPEHYESSLKYYSS